MEHNKGNSKTIQNADLLASLVKFQKTARHGLNKRYHEPLPPLATSTDADPSRPPKKNEDSARAVSKHIALFEKQRTSDTTFTHTTVTLHVGTGDEKRTFEADINALRVLSGYFRECFPMPRRRSAAEEIELPGVDPLAVEMFIEWSKNPKKPNTYRPTQYSEEPWLSGAVCAWRLAHILRAPTFEKYALSQFIQNCAIAIQGPWKYIEDCFPPESSLSLFSNHWVAWNTYLSGKGTNEYTGLKAAKNASNVRASTRDPRVLELDHWYSECGQNINARCEHDLTFQEEQKQRNVMQNRPPASEWGAEAEAR